MGDLCDLTIDCDTYFGFCPKTDLRQIRFSRLTSLKLGHYAFSSSEDLEWIISHGHTLRKLYLMDCAIVCEATIDCEHLNRCNLPIGCQGNNERVSSGMIKYHYQARWHDYFDSFRKYLSSLRHFHIGTRDAPNQSFLTKDRYLGFFDFEFAYPYGISSQFCDRLDMEALCALQEGTGQRIDEDCLTYKGLPRIYEQWGIKTSDVWHESFLGNTPAITL